MMSFLRSTGKMHKNTEKNTGFVFCIVFFYTFFSVLFSVFLDGRSYIFFPPFFKAALAQAQPSGDLLAFSEIS